MELVHSHAVDRGDAYFADDAFRELLEALLHGIEPEEDVLGDFEEDLARQRRGEIAFAPFDELVVVPLLEAAHLLADG